MEPDIPQITFPDRLYMLLTFTYNLRSFSFQLRTYLKYTILHKKGIYLKIFRSDIKFQRCQELKNKTLRSLYAAPRSVANRILK